MAVSNIKKVLLKKIKHLEVKYSLMNFYDGFLDELFNEVINNLKNDNNIENQFVSSFKDKLLDYINNHNEELKEKTKLIIEQNDSNKFIQFCLLLDSLNYDGFNLAHNLFKENSKSLNGIMEDISNSNFSKDSNNLSYFMTEYFDINEENIEENNLIDLSDITSSDYDSTKIYFNEIGKYKVLTKEEEIQLFKEYKENGSKKARQMLINSNLKLSAFNAKKYLNRTKSMSFLDLVMEGNAGLIKAIDKFDYTKNYRLSTYATWWIRQAIGRAIYEKDREVRIPVHMEERLLKIRKVKENYEFKYGCEPTISEISDILDINEDKIRECLNYASQHEYFNLNQNIGDKEDTEVSELIPINSESVEDEVEKKMLKEDIIELMKVAGLTEREARVISYRFGIIDGKERTLDEIGKIYNCTRERIRQIEKKSLFKLKKAANRQAKIKRKIYEKHNSGIYAYFKEDGIGKYEPEQIRGAIKRMHPISIAILKKRCGDDFSRDINIYAKELSFLEKKILSRILSNDLPYALKDMTYIQKELKFTMNDLLETFDIENLDDDEKKFLYKLGGSNFENIVDLTKISKQDYEILNLLINKLLNLQESKDEKHKPTYIKKVKSIYELLNKYSKEDIDDVIYSLSKEEQDLLYLRYGKDLANSIINYNLSEKQLSKINNIAAKIKKLVKNNYLTIEEKEKQENKNLIYKKYPNNTKEEIDSAISRLSAKQKRIFDIMNGNNGEEKTQSVKNYYTKILKLYIPKLLASPEFDYNKKNTKKVKKKKPTIYEIYSSNTKEEVDSAISRLSIKQKRIYDIINGNNEEEKTSSVKNYYTKILKIYIPKLLDNPEFDYNKKNTKKVKKEKPTIYEIYSNNTKEEVNSAISRLSIKQKRIFDIMNGNNDEEKTDSVKVYYNKIIKVYIKNLLLDSELDYNKRVVKNITSQAKKEILNAYEMYSNNTKEEIDDAISRLSIKQKRIFDIMNSNNIEEKTHSVQTYYNKIIKVYIKNLLLDSTLNYNKPKHYVKEKQAIYEKYPSNTKEEVDSAISRLSIKQKRIFDIMNSNNREEKTISVKNYYTKIVRIYIPKLLANPEFDYNKIIIKKTTEKRKKEKLTIYEKYSDNTNEEIDSAISRLSIKQKRIYDIMNSDKEEEKTDSVKNYYTKILKLYIPKLLANSEFDYNKPNAKKTKSIIKQEKLTIYDRYPYNTKEEIDSAISKLTPANMRIVTLMNGTDLLNPRVSSEVTISIRNRYSTIVNKMIPKLLCDDTDMKIYSIGDKINYSEKSEDNSVSVINSEKIKPFINTKAFSLAIDKFSDTEKEIIILSLTNKYDIKVLSKLYNVHYERIISMVEEALINFKENIINSFDIVEKEYTKKK